MRILAKGIAIGLALAAFGGAASLEAAGFKVERKINGQVEVDKKEPRQVAAAFLKAKGVTR
jgi:hypothetical protein